MELKQKTFFSMTISLFCVVNSKPYGASEERDPLDTFIYGLGHEELDYSYNETLNESDDPNKLISAPGCPE